MTVEQGIEYREVARVPDRVDGGELVRWLGSSEAMPPHWRWWSLSGGLGAVTFIEIPDSVFGGDFGVHFRDGANESCHLIGECRYAANGPVGAMIAEDIRKRGAEHDELVKMAVVWGSLTALYYGYLHPESVEVDLSG